MDQDAEIVPARTVLLRKYLPVLALFFVGGMAIGWSLAPAGSSSTEARAALALVNVSWSEMEATHRSTGVVFAESVAPVVDGVMLEPPSDYQLTAFGIRVGADSADEAIAKANMAADLLVQAVDDQRAAEASTRRESLVAGQQEIEQATDELAAEIEVVLANRQTAIDGDGDQGFIDELSSDFRALDTQRNRLAADLATAEAAVLNFDAEAAGAPKLVQRIGSAQPTGLEVPDRRPIAALAGGIAATWLGATLLLGLLRRRARPEVVVPGVRTLQAGGGNLDLLSFAGLRHRVEARDGPTCFFDLTPGAGASLLVSAFETGSGTVVSEEILLVGRTVVLVASSPANAARVQADVDRLRRNEVHIDCVVLLDEADRNTMSRALAPASDDVRV